MSKAKKIISMLLVVMMILTVAPVSVLASAADPAYTYGDVSFSKTEFSVSTNGTTDVIRIAANAGSFSVPASGQEGTIVSATPSGIPQNSGTFNAVAYAGETPSPAKIVFSITGAKPDAVPTVTATNISGLTVALASNETSGDTTTYTWNITAGTALKGANVCFTITYKLKGVSYQAFAYSHVEHILVMNGWLGHLSRKSGTNVKWRHAIIFQLQSKNMYSGMNSGSPTKTLAYINYASEQSATSGALLGCGNEDNVSGEITAYASAVPNNAIPGEEVGAFIKFRAEQTGGRHNGCLADDGNRSESMVYIDKRDENLRSLNMRATLQAGEHDKFTSMEVREVTFHNYAFTFGTEDYDFTSSASTSEFSAVNYTSGPSGTNVIAQSRGLGDYVMIPITGTGPATSTTASNPYSIVADCYASDTYVAGGMNVDFRVYDSTVLWNVYNGVVNGHSLSGTSTYTTPSNWSAAPSFVCTFDKGPHIQASQFSSGWSEFKSALDTAGALLAAPDVTQTELDNAAVALYQAYAGLGGYNANVNWQINHYLEGTTTPIIPTQTVDVAGTIFTQGQPAGSVWLANAAQIEGYVLTSSESQNMTLSGNNATESFTFYYKPREYNLIVETNTGADASIMLTPTGKKIYESELSTGTLDSYTFDGWYYDDGTWSQPVFTQSDEGGKYMLMPGQQTTIFGKWVTTPIDIQYVPVADGVELPVVSRGEQVRFPDGQTTAQFARPADLDVDGYIFVNYYADKELTTPASFPLTFTLGVTQTPYTIYARMVDVNGKISFESNGGSAVSDINFTAGNTVNAPAAPTLKGYTFAGWYSADGTERYFYDEATGAIDAPETMANNTGFIAYAHWTPNEYTISFDLGTPTTDFDTVELMELKGYADTAIPADDLPPAPKKFGYEFHHWELDGERYELETYPTEDIVLTPYWVATDYSAFIDINAYEKLSGNYVETSTAEVGDVITFRMTSQTNFFTGSSLFVFMYDKDFFELVGTGNDAFVLNENSDYISGIDATHIGVTTDSSLPWPSELEAVRGEYNAMMIAIDPQVTASNYKTAPMKDGQWVVEFKLRIKDGATGTGKVYMDNEWTRTPDNIMGTMFYGWSKTSTEVYNTFNNVVTPDLEKAFAEISIEEVVTPDTEVKLLAGDGAYADGDTYKEYAGRAETEILDYVAPTRDGYDLVGWTNTADGTTVDWTDEFYYPTADKAGTVVEYTAVWEAKVYSVTFYTDETLSTVYYKTDYAYDSEFSGPPATPSKKGYSFKAWVNAETGEEITLPAICKGEASYYPSFAPATNTPYTVKISYFNNQTGAETSTTRSMTGTTGYTVVIDNTVGSEPNTIYLTPADLPAVTGYEFDPDNNNLPITGVINADGNLVLEVKYKAALINVTLDANGGTFADGSSTAIISGEFQSSIMEADLPAAPTKPGYVFKGYQNLTFTDGVGNRKYTPNSTYKAVWDVVKYTMTFDAGVGAFADGEKTKTVEVAMNGAITAPAAPAMAGYSFIGWSLNGGDATTALGNLDVAEARTYVAVYEKTPFNVYYYIDGALVPELSEIKYVGDSVTIADEPTRYGYDFSGWELADGTAAVDFTMGAEDVEIYGGFTAKLIDVTFDANGGFFGDDTSVTTTTVATAFDSAIKPPVTAPTRAGYEFLGWAASLEDAASKTTITSWPALETEEAGTYYAAWNATTWEYTVKFYYQDVNGQYGAEAADETLVLNGQVASVVNYDAVQTKEGFTLDAESVLSGIVSVEDPLVLEVKYVRNQHTLTIDIDGQKTTTDVYYGAAVAVPADPSKVGYTFDGWNGYTDGMTMPDEDVTITAVFTANQYTVTYYADETKTDVEYTRTAAYGSDYTVPTPSKVGHDFAGWMNADGTDSGLTAGATTQIPLDGAEYYATWTVLSYNVVYRANGGAWSDGNTKTFAVPYGTAQADWQKPADPERAGYTFGGWNMANAPATMPAEQVNILATWSQETYTVIFKDSLTDEIYSEGNYIYNDMVIIPAPEKEGYEFIGWTDAEGNDVEPIDMMTDIGDDGASVTYIAKWDALEYTITFETLGGSEIAPITQDFGTAIGEVAEPTKTGYTFAGWTPAIPATMPAEDITITAQWTVNQYTITFNTDGGNEIAPITKDYKAAIGVVADPVKTGYTFAGWSPAIPATMPAEDTTVVAQWTVNQYTVTFDTDGGSTVAPITQDYETAITAPAAPTKEGYTFAGWEPAIPATMPAKDTTVVAQWTINTHDVIYYVDGEVYETVTDVAYGTEVTAIAAPTKEGYTFSGWDKTAFTMPDADVTVSGTFAVNKYDVIYKVDGVETNRFTVEYNSAVTVIDEPTKVGYTFSGWDTEDFTMPAKDVEINGTFAINSYDVIYMVDGVEYKTETYEYNSAVTVIDEPTKEGYTFSGWDKADFTMPAEDVVISGTFAANEYELEYIVDGEVYRQGFVVFGTEVTIIDEPTKEGYTFSGWSQTEAFTMPAAKVTITGSFAVNSYDVIYYVDGVETNRFTVEYNSAVTVIDEPTKEGYTFSGWDTEDFTMPAKDVVISGTFAINSYDVIYYVDGVETNRFTVEYNTAVTVIAEPTKEGYTFSGWDTEDFTMPAKNVEINGTFAINSYDVIYMVDGVAYKTETYEYNSAVTVIDGPTKTGYTFSGWSQTEAFTMPAEDVVINGTFTAIIYTITWVDGNDATEDTVQEYIYEQAITAPAAPAKEGYQFIMWVDANGNTPDEIGTMPTANLVFTAVYETGTVAVYYNVNGVLVAHKSAEYGEAIVTGVDAEAKKVKLPNYKTPAGYEFDGWYTDAACTVKLADGATVGATAVNLYAKETAGTYDAIFYVDGEVYATVPTVFEAGIALPAEPAKAGYTFTGWTPDATIMDSEGMTFEATWVVTDGAYTVTYYVDGEPYAEYALAIGEEFDTPADPYKKGYEFMGWATTEDATAADTVELPEFMPAENLVYYAIFELRSAKVEFYVNKALDASPYKDTALELYSSADVSVGDIIEMPADPTNIDDRYYTFIGWTDVEGGEEVVYTSASEIEMTADDITLYAVYERVAVKLMPMEDSTTVIERDYVIESYLDDSVTTEGYDTEGFEEEDFDYWFVYGLDYYLWDMDLEDFYIEVQGDGRIDIETSTGDEDVGTGTIIRVYDNVTGEMVEMFYVVIAGDLDGNGLISSRDTTKLTKELSEGEWSEIDVIAYLVKAADLDSNGVLSSRDTTRLTSALAGDRDLDQTFGLL